MCSSLMVTLIPSIILLDKNTEQELSVSKPSPKVIRNPILVNILVSKVNGDNCIQDKMNRKQNIDKKTCGLSLKDGPLRAGVNL